MVSDEAGNVIYMYILYIVATITGMYFESYSTQDSTQNPLPIYRLIQF